jgi:glutamine cyclotransferase
MSRPLKIWVPVLLVALGAICVAFYLDSRARARDAIPVYTYKIVNTYPHDRNAFTQGLVFADGFLYEGTGLRGRSALRKVKLETGEVLQRRNLGYEFFGEGVTIYGDKIIQLTLRANVGFVYDKETFKLLREFNYSNEGWGITHNGKRLIMSDGTSRLHFLNPETFEQIGRIKVRDSNGAVTGLNELEYVKGQVYANIWGKDRIAQINPQSGKVTGWIELAGLLSPKEGGQLVDVLNGIAYDAENDRLFVTGKWWPKLFEIRVTVPE